MSHVVVIGAGITGVTAAYSLLQLGHTVSVIERHGDAAMETSYANGGQLSASNAEVWNSWSTIARGLRWMFQTGAPLLLNPKPSFHKYSWLAEFCANIPHARANTLETTRLAILARGYLLEIAHSEKIDFDYLQRGILHLYHDAKSFRRAERGNALLREAGLDRIAVTRAEMQRIEPGLRGTFYGGFYTASDATGDIHKFTRGLTEACKRQGAQFLFNRRVCHIDSKGPHVHRVDLVEQQTGVACDSITADAILVCAGVASREFAAALGDRVNIYPVKGYSITVMLFSDAAQRAAPTVSLLDDAAKIVTSRLGRDRFRIAGTAEFNGFNRDIRADRITPLTQWCQKFFPELDTVSAVPWAGLRPMMPNMMPLVGRGKRRGIYYNTGHGHLGWTLSGATAPMVAKLIDADMRAAVQ